MKQSAWLLLLPLCILANVDEIRGLLANRVDEARKTVGIVVGTIGPTGREIVAYGRVAKDRPERPDGDTVYEIGSITKVFTSLLLADMIERGEVTPDTPVAALLPETVKVPSRNGRQITLLDLSMQVSGLPRLPNNLRPADFADPYADYDSARLYSFLASYTLPRDPGEKYEYSNLAVGLLGHALARRAGMSYEDLVRKRILEPLAMTSSSITLSPAQKQRLAPGYDAGLSPVKNWNLDALAGAGALRSTANDMLKFLAANLELTDTPLKPAMRRMRSLRHDTGSPDLAIMMGWHLFTKYSTDMVWHNGGTAGYHSFAGFVPARKTGVVVLTNAFYDIDDIGRHLLESQWPAAKLVSRTAIEIAPEILAGYAGQYPLAPAFIITVTAEGSHLYIQATGQPRFEAFAEKETEFFLKVVDAQISFVRDGAGKVTHLILHQNGMDQKAPRK